MSKECKVCGEEIKDCAFKCVHCSSFQNWRRYLTFSSTVLSLFVALASVIAVGTPPIIKAFHTERSKFQARLLDIGPIYLQESGVMMTPEGRVKGDNNAEVKNPILELNVLLTNIGERNGFVNLGHLNLRLSDSNIASGTIQFSEDLIFKPNDLRRMKFELKLIGENNINILSKQNRIINISDGKLIIDTYDQDLTPKNIEIPIGKKDIIIDTSRIY